MKHALVKLAIESVLTGFYKFIFPASKGSNKSYAYPLTNKAGT